MADASKRRDRAECCPPQVKALLAPEATALINQSNERSERSVSADAQ